MVVLREKVLGRTNKKLTASPEKIFAPRIELGISRVLGERHDQLDHTDLNGLIGVSGFRSQYLDLAKVARFRLRQYPAQVVEYLGFDPSTSSLRRTRASDCANTPDNCQM